MPQISPMKWMMLNLITQSSIIQLISFLTMKKTFSILNQKYFKMSNKKLSWQW